MTASERVDLDPFVFWKNSETGEVSIGFGDEAQKPPGVAEYFAVLMTIPKEIWERAVKEL